MIPKDTNAFYIYLPYLEKRIAFKYTATLLLLLLLNNFASAQPTRNTGINNPSNTNNQNQFTPVIDTFGVYYFTLENPYEEKVYQDTTIDGFQRYDKIYQYELPYANLGNVGSPTRSIFYQPTFQKGLTLGLKQFDLYLFDPNKIPYYRLHLPLSKAAYNQNNKENLLFAGVLSRNFANGINVGVHAFRSNNQGFYQNQRAKIAAFANTWWYHSKNGKYDGYLSMISSSITHQDNGGINLPELSPALRVTPIAVPVIRSEGEANTTHLHRSFSYKHSYQIKGARPRSSMNKKISDSGEDFSDQLPMPSDTIVKDTLKSDFGQIINLEGDTIGGLSVPKNTKTPAPLIQNFPKNLQTILSLSHQFNYSSHRYQYGNSSPDSSQYGIFYKHQRALLNLIHHKKLENAFAISAYQFKNDSLPQRRTNKLLEVGMSHTLHWLDQGLANRKIHNLFLNGKARLNLRDRFQVEVYFHYGLLDNANDYQVKGNIKYALPKLGSLSLGLIQQANEVSATASRLVVSERLVWENDFKKVFETTLSAQLFIEKFKIKISGKYFLINNYLYYNASNLPTQAENSIHIGQLLIEKNFRVWKVHLDNKVIVQSQQALLPAPQIYSIQSLYFKGYLFKKSMLSQAGVDFRINDAFTPPSYFALTGQFYLQEEQRAVPYPSLDLFINFKVKGFRFFAKYEDLAKLWYQTFYIQTGLYPEPYNRFRFGVSWRFDN